MNPIPPTAVMATPSIQALAAPAQMPAPAPPASGPRFDMSTAVCPLNGGDLTVNSTSRPIMDFIQKCNDPRTKEMAQLLNLQMDVQRAGMNIELMSKTVEHATSGTKTILQTQA